MNRNPPPLTSPAWTGRTKRLVLAGVVIAIALLLLRLSEVLPIIGVGVILAYLLTPLVNFFEKKVLIYGPLAGKAHRNLAVILTYILIITVFVIVILVVVPLLIAQFEEFGRRIPQLLGQVEQNLEQTLSQPLTFNGEPVLIGGLPFIPLERLREVTGVQHISDIVQLQDLNLFGATQSFIGSLTGPAFDFVGGALTAIINIVFLLSMMFFLMRDGSIFADKVVDFMPPIYRGDVRRLLYELGQVWNAYLRGQLTLAMLMGTIVFCVASILGVPNPLILGMISGLLEFIPSIGSGLAIFPAALLALTGHSATLPFLEGAPFAIVVIVIWAALQNIEAIILVPRIMGGSLNLHPLAVIVGILAGASLAGVLGIILAAPMVATLRVFGQYIYGKLMDREPFPLRQPRPQVRRDVLMRRLLWPVSHERVIRLGENLRARFNTRR
ncbi:MAG: AI-2E family transporter [Chloroflexota bacterium]